MHYSTLTKEDVITFLDSTQCDPGDAVGYRNRLIFCVGPVLSVRTTELLMIKCTRFTEESVNGVDAFLFSQVISSRIGMSKTGPE